MQLHAETQTDAVRVALHGNFIERNLVAARALYNILQRPNETRHFYVLGIVLSRSQLPNQLARFALHEEGSIILREQPSIDSTSIDFRALQTLDDSTLGGSYARFISREQLNPDTFQAPPGLPEMIAYFAKRMRQTHDIWHVLTNYGTHPLGELALQAFVYGQMRAPAARLLTIGGLVRFGPREPRVAPMLYRAFRRGTRARYLPPIRWEARFERPLRAVRAELNIEPAAAHEIGAQPQSSHSTPQSN